MTSQTTRRGFKWCKLTKHGKTYTVAMGRREGVAIYTKTTNSGIHAAIIRDGWLEDQRDNK